MRKAIGTLFGLILLLVASPAFGDGVKEYETALAAADAAWQENDFATARGFYEKAYAIHDDPVLLFNIASAYRREKNEDKAVEVYRKFLAVAPDDDPRRELAQATVAEMTASKSVGAKTTPKKFGQDSASGAVNPATKARPTGAKSLSNLPNSSLNSRGENDRGRGMFIGSIVTGSVGALALGYGLFEAKRSSDRNDEFENLPDGTVWTEERQARYQEGKKFASRSKVFTAIGGVAIVTGVVLFVVDRKSNSYNERRVSVTPVAAPGMMGFAVSGRM